MEKITYYQKSHFNFEKKIEYLSCGSTGEMIKSSFSRRIINNSEKNSRDLAELHLKRSMSLLSNCLQSKLTKSQEIKGSKFEC